MNSYRFNYKKHEYIIEFANWVQSISPNLFVTLTFKMDVTKEEAEACMKQFILYLSRACFSKTQFKKGERIKIFPFLEVTKAGRYHYHAMLRVPNKFLNRQNSFKERIIKYWIRMRAINKSNLPRCGGNPKLLSVYNEEWFKFERDGFKSSDCKNIVSYLLKEMQISSTGSIKNMCVDINNINA